MGNFWQRRVYLDVCEANDLINAPSFVPMRHSGWAQDELDGASGAQQGMSWDVEG